MWALLSVLLCLYWILTQGDETIQALDVLKNPYVPVPHMGSFFILFLAIFSNQFSIHHLD